jgi:polar amino acid transport system substrate-binding protein
LISRELTFGLRQIFGPARNARQPYLLSLGLGVQYERITTFYDEARLITILVFAGALLSTCATVVTVPPEIRSELAPTGTLRAAINFGNPVLAQKDPVTGEPRGVSVDLARELGRRLNVPVELVTYDAAGKVFDALKSGAWDIAFLAIDPARASEISFTAPYVIIEGTYMVPADSPLRTIGDVDRDGVRVAVGNKSAYDLYLTRTLKRAQIVRAPSSPAAIEIFLTDKLEAAAGVKQPLFQFAKINPKVRVMDGRFMVIEQAMGTPKGRETGARYLREFVEEMKASGFGATGLERSGQADATVAPKAPL